MAQVKQPATRRIRGAAIPTVGFEEKPTAIRLRAIVEQHFVFNLDATTGELEGPDNIDGGPLLLRDSDDIVYSIPLYHSVSPLCPRPFPLTPPSPTSAAPSLLLPRPCSPAARLPAGRRSRGEVFPARR